MLFLIIPIIITIICVSLLIMEGCKIHYISWPNAFASLVAVIFMMSSIWQLESARKRNLEYQNESLTLLSSYYFQAMTTDPLIKQAEYDLLITEAYKHNVRYAERLSRQDNTWDGYKYRIGYSDKRIDRFIHPYNSLLYTKDMLDISIDILEEDTIALYGDNNDD